jgi:Mce-associated membrane protein
VTDLGEPVHGRAGWLNAVLGVVLVALVATTVLVLVKGNRATPGENRAEKMSAQYDAVTRATTAEINAFLTVDYKSMDPLVAKVLAGATGEFKTQYDRSKVSLIAAAQSTRTHRSGTVRAVGISDISSTSAVVFVAADSVVSNRTTTKAEATKSCPHAGAICSYHRFKVKMTSTSQGWKMSKLDSVS